MGRVYTSGVWTVRPGREAEFVEEWRSFAEWAAEAFPPAGPPLLLGDLDDPRRFVSLGSWPDLDALEAFRSHPVFRERVGHLRERLDSFEARTHAGAVEPG